MKRRLSVLCLLSVLLTCSLQAKKVYVKLNGDAEAWTSVTPDANNVVVTLEAGVTSFTGALGDIAANDVVWVAKGVYNNTGTISLNGDRAGVKLYGGFKGDETSLEDRRLIDADGNGIVEAWEFEYVTEFKGDQGDDNSFRMFTLNTEGVVLDGVTISDNKLLSDTGSGAFLKNNAVMSRCIVRNAITAWAREGNAVNGGGIFVDTTGKLESCLIEDCKNMNLASGGSAYGGGINISGKTSSITNSVIRNNEVSSTQNALGGGLFINSGATAENCVIYNNASGYRGGGVYVHSSGSDPVKLVNLTVVNNMGSNAGGGIFSNRGTTYIYNSIFWGNVNELANPNNINLNQICYADAFAYNGEQGLGVWMEDKNHITSPATVELIPVNEYDDVYTEGNQPKFLRPTTFTGLGYSFLGTDEELRKANWTLQNSSAVIDAGVSSFAVGATTYTVSSTDIMGNQRPNGTKIDLGAYEYSGGLSTISPSLDVPVYSFVTKENGIEINGIETSATVKVYNTLGMFVKSVEITNGQTVNLTQHGIYILSISGESGASQTAKVIF